MQEDTAMMSKHLLEQLNDQMNVEFYTSHAYMAMAAHFASESLDGFANFFTVQAEEERFHAMKIFKFINDMGERATMKALDAPKNDFNSVREPFEDALLQEKKVTARFYQLSDIALEEREHATINFLKWFVDEQVEEESSFDTIINRIKRIENDSNAIYTLDLEFAGRTFAPETE
jgi:ferritin